jgi:hypothetical protein
MANNRCPMCVAGIAVIGIVTVAVIAIAAIALGLTSGDLGVGSLRDRIPFLRSNTDGWVKVEDPEGGFTVEMPSNRQADSVAFPLARNGRLTGWTASIGTETDLSVHYGTIEPQPGETARGTLNRMVDVISFASGVSANSSRNMTFQKRTDTDFAGYPAIEYQIKGTDVNGKNGYESSIIFMKGDVLYSLSSRSVYPDQPQFDRFANSFTFTS